MASAFAQLTLSRIREFIREPEALFWVYGFPLLMATALGIAFRNQPVERIQVDVVQTDQGTLPAQAQAQAAQVQAAQVQAAQAADRNADAAPTTGAGTLAVLGPLAALAGEPRFVVTVGNEQSARRRLRGGKTDVVVIASDAAAGTSDEASGPNAAGASDAARESNTVGASRAASESSAASFVYLYDFTRKESLLARNAVEDALQRAAGRRDAFTAADRNFDEPGGRYIDFLVPGLLGMSLMGGGLWGVGYVIVDMRIRKLLKRFLATPMPRSHFLAAILTSRLLFLLPEVLVLLAFARFVFGVQSQGGLVGVLVFILLGAIAFAGIGLLVASRARTLESVSGLMNLVMLPMWVLSGIFFSSDRFPAAVQPYIKLLPLTMAIDGLRGVMIDGLAAWSQPKELFGLAIWATVSFALALRLFRWN